MGAERRSAVAFLRDGLLLRVYPLAILILRADQNRASRPNRSVSSSGHASVAPQHVHIVPKRLEVVRGPVPQFLLAFVVEHRALLVRLHLQVTAETARGPGSVARIASHIAVGVRDLCFLVGRAARQSGQTPGPVVFANGFRQGRLLVVVRASFGDRVHNLLDPPYHRLAVFVFRDGRALEQPAVLVLEEAVLSRLQPSIVEHSIPTGRRRCARVQRSRVGPVRDSAVTIYAVNLDRVAHFTV